MAKSKQPDDAPVGDEVLVDASVVDIPTDELGRDVPAEWPVGLMIGEGAEATWVGEHEYAVDPETGRITGRL